MFLLNKNPLLYDVRKSMVNMEARIIQYINHSMSGGRNIIFVHPEGCAPSERYRVENILETMDHIPGWFGLSVSDTGINREKFDGLSDYTDILVLERIEYSAEIDGVIEAAKKKSIPVIFSVDDIIYDTNYADLVAESTSQHFWKDLAEDYFHVADMSDAYWATNEYLASKLKNKFNRPVFITSNFMNTVQETVSRDYLAQKITLDNYDDKFMIICTDGSHTHQRDFKIIEGVLVDFMSKHENSLLAMVSSGYLGGTALKPFMDSGRVLHSPFINCAELQYYYAISDVNLAPLQVNEFTNCKSDVKYFEAAAVGTVSCLSPAFSYRNVKERGNFCYICENDRGWMDSLEEIYENRMKARENMTRIYMESVRSYSVQSQISVLKENFNNMLDITGKNGNG